MFVNIKPSEYADDFNIEHSFYLYTKEKIDKIEYFFPPDNKGLGIVLPEKISLLSYKDINIGDLDIPDFMVPHIYKISYKETTVIPTQISLFKNDETFVIFIDINENNDIVFYKNYSSDNTESHNLKEMVFERERLGTIFNEFNIYVVEENSLLFDKFKMNLEIFETLHNLKKVKTKLDLIISASQDQLNPLNESEVATTSENTDWSSIHNCLVSFNQFISSYDFLVINEAFSLRDIDGDCIAQLSENEVMEIVNKKIDDISRLNLLAIHYCNIFDDVTFKDETILIEGRVRLEQVRDPVIEIKKAYEIVKKNYSDYDVNKLFEKINSSINDDAECFGPISETLSCFLKLIDLFETFIKTRNSYEGTSSQKNNIFGSQYELESYKFLVKKQINNIPSLNSCDYKNFEFIKGFSLETLMNDCKNLGMRFDLLVETLKECFSEKYVFHEIFINFKKDVSNYKESVIRFKNIIDIHTFKITFKKISFMDDLISTMHENNEPGPSSAN